MENASKALIMMGGILTAIISISIFYFMFGRSGAMMGELETDTQKQELIAFNKSFEAYNKSMMYGTDVISVLNKAIDNNKKYDVEFGEKSKDTSFMDYYVDIEFKIYNREKVPNTDGIGMKNIKTTLKDPYILSKDYIYKNKSESKIWTLFIDKANKRADDTEGDTDFRDFKFAGFKCTKVEYREKEEVSPSHQSAIGRVKKMTFVEIK